MAATRLIALHQNKGRTVAQSLGERTDYAKNPEKTERPLRVGGHSKGGNFAVYAAAFAASKKGRIAIITVIAVLLIITLVPVRDGKKDSAVCRVVSPEPDDT